MPLTLLRGFLCAVLVTGCASSAGAQEPDPDLARVRRAIFKEIRVTDAAGAQRSGILASVDDDTLHLVAPDGPFTTSIVSAQRIEKRGDSLLSGVLTGAAFGIFYVEVMGRNAGFDAGERLVLDVWVGGFWALIGGAIDALHTGWTTLKTEQRPKEGR